MRYIILLLFLLALPVLIISCSNPVQASPAQTTPTPAPTQIAILTPLAGSVICQATATPVPGVHHLTDMNPGCDYPAWFEDNTADAPDDSYFGGYKIMPWGDTLYLGFGKARPAEFNGSLFARLQSGSVVTLTALYELSEQGFIDMTPDISQPVIHIPGADPTDPAPQNGRQWDLGNTYIYTPTTGAMTKHRNLIRVIHTWGLESTSAGLYAAVSSHLGDYKTWTGEVFRSADRGESWARMADKNDGTGAYRTYDIIQFNGKLYIVWNDVYGEPCGLAESSDGGTSWNRLSDFTGYTQCRSRLFIYKNQLLILGSARDGILALHTDNSVSTHLFPGFHARDWSYNPFAIDAQNRLYIPSDDGRILRTSDLASWETLVASDRDFITLAYWPDQDRIIVADRGEMGRLWLLNPTTGAIQQPPAPEAAISLDGDDVVLQWPAQMGLGYRIYRNDDAPGFVPPIQRFHTGVAGGSWRDTGVGAQPGGIFYQVRSMNAAGDISGASSMLGKFSFELTPGS
jgi:hypothetical protein